MPEASGLLNSSGVVEYEIATDDLEGVRGVKITGGVLDAKKIRELRFGRVIADGTPIDFVMIAGNPSRRILFSSGSYNHDQLMEAVDRFGTAGDANTTGAVVFAAKGWNKRSRQLDLILSKVDLLIVTNGNQAKDTAKDILERIDPGLMGDTVIVSWQDRLLGNGDQSYRRETFQVSDLLSSNNS